jgi:uncharacterized membrane protein YkvA (DUF1232 family)
MGESRTTTWDFLRQATLRGHNAQQDEQTVRRDFWAKMRRVAANLPFAEDALAAYYCAFDRDTPAHVKTALIGALAYFIMPFDIVPDLVPLLGYTDDAAVLAAAIRMVATHLRPEHRAAARDTIQRELSR